VIAKFMLAAVRGGTLKVNGARETLDFTYVDDAATGIVAAALSNNANNQTYNITKSHGRSLLDAANLAVKITGRGTIEVQDRDANFPSRGALNIDAARKDFGYFPQVDIEEGFQAYYEWIDNSVYWSKKTV
jgi:nucleoside-diphosphate-sugar epimerase